MAPSKLLHDVTAKISANNSISIDNLLNEKLPIPIFKLENKHKFYFVDDSKNSAHLTPNLQVPLTATNAPIFATFGKRDPRLYIALNIKNEQIMALVDSGSTRTYMGDSAAKLLGNFEKTAACMTSANNNTIPVDGIRYVDYTIKNVSHKIPTRYIKSLSYGCVFGMDALKSYGMAIDFQTGVCSLPGGGDSWKLDFPDQADGKVSAIVDSISAVDDFGDSRFFLDVTIKGEKVKALVDTGSTRTYLGPKFETILEKSLIPCTASVLLADNSIEPVVGEVNVQLTLAKTRKSLPLRLVHSLGYDCILGMDFLESFGLFIDFGKGSWQLPNNKNIYKFTANNSATVRGQCAGLVETTELQQKQIKNLINKLIKKPGKKLSTTNLTKHVIELTNPTPIKINPRRYSPFMLKKMHELTDEYLAEDVIEPCKSPWSSPPVIARKANGTYRMCIDYRRLNLVTKKHAHPIPNIDSLLDKFKNARYISKIDMTSAFLQISIDEEIRDFTAFSVPGRGQFRFKRMPFGLVNSPSTFQQMMDNLIRNLPPGSHEHYFAYLDDICVVSETFEEHLKWLEILLRGLADANLEVNMEKSEFCCSQVTYLGYIVDSRGLHVDPEKTKAINEYPAPQNLRQLRRFLGMVGWYARFMPEFSADKAILCDLLKKDVRWHWTPDHQLAFEKIKRDLVSAPVLIRPDFSKEFQIHCDASDYAIGAVLTQEIDGKQHPIAFVNRLLTSSERKFTTTEKECKAVLWAIEKFRPYVEGTTFTVYTDHSSLLWLQKINNPSGRLSRWAMSLLAHDINIVHRPGAQNHVPDALSRAFESFLCSAAEVGTEDAWYSNQFQLVNKFPDRYPDWKIVDGKLFVHKPDPWVDPLLGDRDAWNLVVPLELRSQVLHESHDLPTSGHFGRYKTYTLLQRQYYWPGMRVDTARYVKACPECQKVKLSQLGPQGVMHVKAYQEPWARVVTDIQGPFPPTTNQFKYLFVAVDDLTKFVVVKPLRTADGKRLWEALMNGVFLTFGFPQILHADNGTEFDNDLIRKNCLERGIEFTTIPLYHPQANPTERSNKVIKTMLRTFLKENHRKWDEHVYEFAYAINNAPHDSLSRESSKISPAFLNFGRNLSNPHSIFGKATTAISANVDKQDPKFWLDRVKRISAYQDLVKRFLSSASKQQAKSYNVGRKDVGFKIGDLVLRRDHPLSNAAKHFSASLAKKFSGPYKIKKVISQNVYELELPAKSKQNPKAHVRFLKPYVSFTATMSGEYPPYRRGCWNCGGGHDQSSCTVLPRKVYCYTCGWPGKTVRTCPRLECRKKYDDARRTNLEARNDGSTSSRSSVPPPPLPPNIQDPSQMVIFKPSSSAIATTFAGRPATVIPQFSASRSTDPPRGPRKSTSAPSGPPAKAARHDARDTVTSRPRAPEMRTSATQTVASKSPRTCQDLGIEIPGPSYIYDDSPEIVDLRRALERLWHAHGRTPPACHSWTVRFRTRAYIEEGDLPPFEPTSAPGSTNAIDFYTNPPESERPTLGTKLSEEQLLAQVDSEEENLEITRESEYELLQEPQPEDFEMVTVPSAENTKDAMDESSQLDQDPLQ